MLIDKMAILLAPSHDKATAQGIFYESNQMTTEIEPLLRALPIVAAELKGEEAAFLPCISSHRSLYESRVFASTKGTPKALKVRSPDTNPKVPCDIHPDAKVSHTNGRVPAKPS